MNTDITFRRGWVPGALGWVIAEHGRYYDTHWRLGAAFEAKVAAGLGEWIGRYDETHDLFLTAWDGENILGSISLDGSGPHAKSDGARIRYFIMGKGARGRGVGRALMREIMNFLAKNGVNRCFLTTFAGLESARRLYEDFGFTLTHEALDQSWGTPLREQRFEWKRP